MAKRGSFDPEAALRSHFASELAGERRAAAGSPTEQRGEQGAASRGMSRAGPAGGLFGASAGRRERAPALSEAAAAALILLLGTASLCAPGPSEAARAASLAIESGRLRALGADIVNAIGDVVASYGRAGRECLPPEIRRFR